MDAETKVCSKCGEEKSIWGNWNANECPDCRKAYLRNYMKERRKADPEFKKADQAATKEWVNENNYYTERYNNDPGFKERVKANGKRRDIWRKKLYRLAVIQYGKCWFCDEQLPLDNEQVHAHHVLPLAEGGPNIEENIVLVHIHCHKALHSWAKILPHKPVKD